jgi:hypothetical protein
MGAVQAGWGGDDFSSLARHYAYSGSVKDHAAELEVSGSTEEETAAKKKEKGSPSKRGFLGMFGRAKRPVS